MASEDFVTVMYRHYKDAGAVCRLPRPLINTPEARALLAADYAAVTLASKCIGYGAREAVLASWEKYKVHGKRSHDDAVVVCHLREPCDCADGDTDGCAPADCGERKALGITLCGCLRDFLRHARRCGFCLDAIRAPGGMLADHAALRAFWLHGADHLLRAAESGAPARPATLAPTAALTPSSVADATDSAVAAAVRTAHADDGLACVYALKFSLLSLKCGLGLPAI